MLFCSKFRKSYLLIFVLIFGYLHTFLQLFLVNGQRLALATTAPRSSPMHPEDCLKGKSLGILLKMTRVLRQSVVIDSRVLSLTLKRLRRLLTIRLRSEEDECRFYTINAWHCQAFISQVNWNLKFRSRTSVLCRSLFCLSFEKTAEEGIIREVKSLGYFRDCL